MGFVVSVLGGKGGVGKSIFTVNYGFATLIDQKKKVLLIDMDKNSSMDLGVIAGLKQKQTILHAIKSGKFDSSNMAQFLTSNPQGLSMIPGALNPDEFDSLALEQIGRIIQVLAKAFSYVVIDCGSTINDQVAKCLELSTAIFLLTAPDILVLNQTRRMVDQLQTLLFPSNMVQLIVNKYNAGLGITPQLIQGNLKRNIIGVLPEDHDTSNISLTKGQPFILSAPRSELTKFYFQLVRFLQEKKVLESLEKIKKPTGVTVTKGAAEGAGAEGAAAAAMAEGVPGEGGASTSEIAKLTPWNQLKFRIHKQLVQTMDLRKIDTEVGTDPVKKKALADQTRKAIMQILEKDKGGLKTREEIQKVVKEVLDEALNLGCLEDMLANKEVTEIMVLRASLIYVELEGRLRKSKTTFTTNQQLLHVIERIVAPLGRRIDEKTPYVDARLDDGSRVHAIIPPLAIDGPMLTIRKFPEKRLTYKDLVKFQAMTEEIADFLRACVEAKLNIVISGGTGSGKTTLLNVMSSFIPQSERILTVEDAAELNLAQEHVGRMETRPPNIEGEGEVSIRDLVKQTLRMRPDRIVVGECRGGETLDMLQAMNTGHSGSMTTVHSNSPRDAVSRIETLCMMAGMDLPQKAIRDMLASAVNLIIQQSRLMDGSRKVTYITEITGMQGDVVTMQDVFIYKQSGMTKDRKVIGKFVATGFVPKFIEQLEAMGIKIPRGIFSVS